jgi:hypothetical protein
MSGDIFILSNIERYLSSLIWRIPIQSAGEPAPLS